MKNPSVSACRRLLVAAIAVCFLSSSAAPAAETVSQPSGGTFPVTIKIDAAKTKGPLNPIWRFFGYDEPNFTYMKNGQKLLGELGQLGPQTVFIRTHHLLTSGDGSPALKWGSTDVYKEDAKGNAIYDWTIVDRIFGTYLDRGLKPYVQIGFMPEALSSHPQDYPHNPPFGRMVSPGSGFSYPPKDYAKWGELCYQWAKHCVEKYGRSEVEKWWWEVWNEPNINYWKGTPEEFNKLYDYAIDGVRRALPTARVGGPETAGGPGGRFLQNFLEHCLRGTNHATGKTGSPLDFIAFHAKGSPRYTNDHIRMGISSQLRNIDDGFAAVASFPELKNKPIVIGESDPEGCAACTGREVDYRNGTVYSSYTAASFARKYELADKHGVNFEGALTWAFEFENQPYFAGFRQLASNGLDLPVLNVFRMFGKMSGQRLSVASSGDAGVEAMRAGGVRDKPDVSALASLNENQLFVMMWHYHDDDLPGPVADVELTLAGLPWTDGPVRVRHYGIDADHSNSFEAWKRMGSPKEPTPEQYAQLESAGQLAALESPASTAIQSGGATLRAQLPRQAVSLMIIEK
jgi:xylan 1,4-beta-xylosidase